MTPSQRKQLLEYVSSGLDVEAGAAQLGLSMSAVRKVGAKLARQLDEAYATGSARLRGRLLKAALTDNDLKVIQSLLEQRAISSAEGKGVRQIERHVIDQMHCPNCQHPLVELVGGQSRPLHTKRGTETPTNGADS